MAIDQASPRRRDSTSTTLSGATDSNHEDHNARSLEEGHNGTSAGATNLQPEKQSDRIRVDWDKDDPENPQTWKFAYKCFITFQLGMLALAPSFGSSVISPAGPTIARYLGVGHEVTVLNVSLYVLGFAVGPILWAPISEVWGRKISMLPPLFCLGLFSVGASVSKNAESLFICRFFGGVFGSAPISNVSAGLGDLWSREARGTAVSLYAIMVVGGPTLAPVAGAALTVNLSWRWTEYVEAIFVFTVFAFTLVFFPEIYGPVLLKRKAQKLRKETGNQAFYHPLEETKLDLKSIVTKQFSRPLLMLTTEPMVMCIAFYASFVYAVLYMTLEVFPIVFEDVHHLNPILSSCAFLGLFVGVIFALSINLGNQPRYIRAVRASGGKPVPEARLPPMAIGAVIFAVGLFWFGWTGGYQDINIASPLVATAFIGAGFNSIFQQAINYLIDTYGIYAASATAANTFLRSLLACGLPLAVQPMFRAMGVGPGMSVLGGVAALAIPVPFLFMRFGVKLRKRSRFAPVD